MAVLMGYGYVGSRRCESCFHGVMSPSRTTVCSSGTIYVCGSCKAEYNVLDTPQPLSKLPKIKNVGKTRCKKCKTWFMNSIGCSNGCKGSY